MTIDDLIKVLNQANITPVQLGSLLNLSSQLVERAQLEQTIEALRTAQQTAIQEYEQQMVAVRMRINEIDENLRPQL